MRQISLLIILLLICVSGANAQWATFTPIERQLPGQTVSNNNVATSRTTGYVLDEYGSIDKKFQVKVSLSDNGLYRIVEYYEIIEGFSANWLKVSSSVYKIGGQLAITRMEKVAFSNFTHYSYLLGNKVWLNP